MSNRAPAQPGIDELLVDRESLLKLRDARDFSISRSANVLESPNRRSDRRFVRCVAYSVHASHLLLHGSVFVLWNTLYGRHGAQYPPEPRRRGQATHFCCR